MTLFRDRSFPHLALAAVACLVGASQGGEPLVDLSGKPATVVCLGDSVTGVYYHTGGYRAYPEMLEVAIAQAAPESKVKVVNAGISGHSTTEGLVRLDKDVLAHKPDLVTISFGLNDMSRVPADQYRANLKELVRRCREAKSQVVLCTPNTVITTGDRPIEKLVKYCDILRQVGTELAVPVCDQFAAGEADKAKDAWAWRLTLSDAIHPNMDGHKRMAEELCRTATGKSVSLADTPPPADPLRHSKKAILEGGAIKIAAMAPFDQCVVEFVKKLHPEAKVELTALPTEGKTLPEVQAAVHETVRELRPNIVIVAVPRTATAKSDEEFVHSYSWTMNMALSFGAAEWDCVVVHPSVADKDNGDPRDDLVRRLVRAQDLHLIDRAKGDESSVAELFGKWVREHGGK